MRRTHLRTFLTGPLFYCTDVRIAIVSHSSQANTMHGVDGTVAQGFDLRSGNVTFLVPFVPAGSYIITCETFGHRYHVAKSVLT